ncbi:MAG: polymerase factor sigma-54, partial [Nevskia sp.]|nr:polymerase factor sigma-54 [Nevskia sp.]
MKQSLSLRAGLSLTMTPALQQAIRLLQLSSLDLQVEIQQALESNVMLEALDAEGEATDSEPEEALAEAETGDGEESAETSSDTASETTLDLNDDSAIRDDMPVDADWGDIYDTPAASGSTASTGNSEDDEGLRDYMQ